MKVSCTKNNLQTGLAVTSHLSTKNIQLPILNNVLVVAKNGNIRLTSTNLEIAVSCLIRGKIEEEGEITIPAKLLYDYISLLKEEKINLWTEENTLNIEAGDYKTKINGLPSSDFPLVPAVSTERNFVLPADLFRQALSQVIFSVASNESRPELSGVFLNFSHNEVVLVATDSYRLSEKKIKTPNNVTNDKAVIIPARTMIEVNRVLSLFKDSPETPQEIQISLSENQAVFNFASVELISRVIEGNFPDYQQIIPKSFQSEAKVNREDIINAIKTASLFSRSGLFDVTITISSSGLIRVAAADATRGENNTETKATVSGSGGAITLNFRYLLDGLQVMETPDVLFQITDGSSPCLLKPVGGESQYLYIVMPIRQ